MQKLQSKIVNQSALSLSKGQSLWVMMGLVGLAAAVRFPSLFANSFHADEALYGSYARLIGTGQDLLLRSVWLDKPPFLFYMQALFYPVLGTPAPFVACLPNFIASLLLVPLVGRLAWQLYGNRWVSWIAAAFWLSFGALRDLAVQQGIAPDVAWLYPAIIDGAIIVFSLSVVQVSLAGERPRWAIVIGHRKDNNGMER